VRDIDNLLSLGVAAQIQKLEAREHKGPFPTDPLTLVILIDEEVQELHEALIRGDKEEIRLEAADVANYAHMLIRSVLL
jgi:NTP pyrophosphatase (non-canonical NTP hydrolase)